MVTSESCARRATTSCMAVRQRGSVKPPGRLSRAAGSRTTGFSPAAFHFRRLSARVWAEQRMPSAASRADMAAHRWARVVPGPNPCSCSLRPGARPVSISTMRSCQRAASSSWSSRRSHVLRTALSAVGAAPPARTAKSSVPTSHRYDTARGASAPSCGTSVTTGPRHSTASHSRPCQRTRAPMDKAPARRLSPVPATCPLFPVLRLSRPRRRAAAAVRCRTAAAAATASGRRGRGPSARPARLPPLRPAGPSAT